MITIVQRFDWGPKLDPFKRTKNLFLSSRILDQVQQRSCDRADGSASASSRALAASALASEACSGWCKRAGYDEKIY